MGSETTCSGYYNNQEMNYYQMESNNRNRESDSKSESQIKEEQTQRPQESRLQNSSNHNTNTWVQMQNNNRPSSSSSSSATSGWSFPNYQRFYNEGHYSLPMTPNHHQIVHHPHHEQLHHQQPQIASSGNTLVALTSSNPGSGPNATTKRYYFPGQFVVF